MDSHGWTTWYAWCNDNRMASCCDVLQLQNLFSDMYTTNSKKKNRRTICRTETSWRVADKELWGSRKTERQFASRKQWCVGIGMTQRKQERNWHWFGCQSVTPHDSNIEMRKLHNWESKSKAHPTCIHIISKHKMNRPSDDYEWFMSCNRSWRRLRTHKSTWRNITK